MFVGQSFFQLDKCSLILSKKISSDKVFILAVRLWRETACIFCHNFKIAIKFFIINAIIKNDFHFWTGAREVL